MIDARASRDENETITESLRLENVDEVRQVADVDFVLRDRGRDEESVRVRLAGETDEPVDRHLRSKVARV